MLSNVLLGGALATYFSLNFALFSIFFMFKFFKFYKFFSFNNLIIFYLFNSFSGITVHIYLRQYIFLNQVWQEKDFDLTDSFNFSNKILIISSIIFFYLIPFIYQI